MQMVENNENYYYVIEMRVVVDAHSYKAKFDHIPRRASRSTSTV